MGNLLGKEKPLKEVLRENKRMINKAVRELDREKTGLEREEKRLVMEIKKAAKENQMQSVKIMAKDLVRTRQHIAKFIEMRRYAIFFRLTNCEWKKPAYLRLFQSHAGMRTQATNR